MAVNIAAGDVLEQVAFRLHLPAFSSGEFISETEALVLLSSSAKRLSGLMSRLYGDAMWAATVDLTTQAGIDILSLPSDFVSLRSVHWMSAGRRYLLDRADPQEQSDDNDSWDVCRPPRYRVEGTGVLVFVPTPGDAFDVHIEYQNNGIDFADISATVQGLPGWDEWLVLDMCQRIREREQKPADEFIRDRLELEGHLKEQASQRDRFAPVQVRDARGSLSGGDRRCRYGRRGRWR